MRLQAEKDRLARFKNIAVSSVSKYYNIIETIAKMLEQQDDKMPELLQSLDLNTLDENTDHQHVDNSMGQGNNFQTIMRQVNNDTKLKLTLQYMTEFIRQVVENGFEFN